MAERRHSSSRPHHDAIGCRRPRSAGAAAALGQWIQVDCRLAAADHDDVGPRWWRQLDEAIAGWRAQGRVRSAFFVRKPPGLRLRLLPATPDGSAPLQDDLADWLCRVEQERLLPSWRFGSYMPEFDRFGGRSGMQLAHEHFDAGSRLALGYESLPADRRDPSTRALLSLATMNDLMARCVTDAVELGDVWVRVNDAMDTYVRDDQLRSDLDPHQVFAALAIDSSWLVGLPEDVHQLLVTARRDNQQVGDRVRAAVAAGRLDAGLCGWLADLCLFHWNRMGLPASTARPLTATVTSLLRRPL